jgi:hypothetical protein
MVPAVAQGNFTDPGANIGARVGTQQQKGGGHRADETREGRNSRGDRRRHGLAETHRPRVRQHSWKQGRREDRVGEERRRGTQLSRREVAASSSTNALPVRAGAALCASIRVW